MRYFNILILCFFILSCNKAVIKKDYDFSSVKTIAVDLVEDIPSFQGSGNAVERVLIHQLLKNGMNVVERQKLPSVLNESSISQAGIIKPTTNTFIESCDALLFCTIIEFKDSETILVPIEIEDKGKTVTTVETKFITENDSTKSEGKKELLTEETTHYKGNITKTKELRYLDAVVGLSLQLIDIKSGSVIWSSNYSYSSLQRSTAIRNCVKGALKPLKKILK